jgi:hypothetical protein
VKSGQILFAKNGRSLENLAIHVHEEHMLHYIQLQRAPRNCKQFSIESEEPAEREDRVNDTPSFEVHHEFLNAPQILVVATAN